MDKKGETNPLHSWISNLGMPSNYLTICFKHNHTINQTHSQNKSTIFTISNDKYKTMCDIHYNVQEHITSFEKCPKCPHVPPSQGRGQANVREGVKENSFIRKKS